MYSNLNYKAHSIYAIILNDIYHRKECNYSLHINLYISNR